MQEKIYYFCKRLLDIIGGLIGCILLIPITIIIKFVSILNKDYDSIFFTQDRIGKDGKTIKIYKFRSMIPNAEDVLEVLMRKDPKIRKEYLENKKLDNDPRITKIGKFIRRYSIDEFPQLLNVLIGNMTLVGPRPYLFREKEDMGEYYDYVITCKPGITGLWQVSGRSDISFKNRLKLDKKYALEKNIKEDIMILFKTFKAVLGKKGAK
ncbi:MAG: sugar transferase [Bacilli bacterium]|nr:sugar transferase [Bacilli bacterium]